MNNTLYTLDASGQPVPATFEQVLATSRAMLAQRFRRGVHVQSPKVLHAFLRNHYALHEHETFMALFLDSRHRLIEAVELFRGTINECSVYSREVVKAALSRNAAAVIFAHNHPSSADAYASPADELITAKLKDALSLVDIRVVDHLITAGDSSIYSFAEHGLL
jgi:DNA repair protein RadC